MCAILMYSFQSHLCSLLFASSLSAFFIYIFFVVCTVSNLFLSLSSCNIMRVYLFVPCLHSRMIFCVPRFLHNRICTMFIYLMFVCRVVHIFFLFNFASVFRLSTTRTDRTTTTTKKILTYLCARVYECISI